VRLRNTVLITLLHCVLFVSAQQGNYKFNNYGNRSILLAGNVTGSVSDLALAYYNPSFLAISDNVGISLNAKAYQLENFKLKDILNENTTLSSSKFNNVSTMAGGIFNLFNTRFAYSYLTKSNYNIDLNYDSNYVDEDILALFPDTESHNANIGIKSSVREDWSGLTWAYIITDRFSVGISAFGSVYNYKGTSNLSHTIVSSSNSVSYYESATRFTQKSYGLYLKVGSNYQFEKFSIGLNINLPYMEFYNDGSFDYTEVIAGVSPEFDKFIDNDFEDLKAKKKEPIGVSVGAGIPFNKNKIHINIDYVSGISKYDRLIIPDLDTGDGQLTTVNFDEERRPVINFGIGFELYIEDNLSGYGGFSTDFSALTNSANIFDISAEENKEVNIGEDFYHFSLGADWKLKWASLIMGITFTNSSKDFLSPYRLNADGIDIQNDIKAQLKYSRWQFVIGLDIPLFSSKLKNLSSSKN